MLEPVEDILFRHLVALRNDGAIKRIDPLAGTLHVTASSAGQCSRAIAFRITETEATNPPMGDSLFNFYIGDAVHEIVQRAIVAHWPNATTEVIGTVEDFLSGHCDVMYAAEDGEIVICEIKSVSDFAFELATGVELKSNGRWRKKDRKAEGPKAEHLLQDLIYAKMHGAKYIAIVYARKTATKDEPVLHEWRFIASDFAEETEAEIERLRGIVNSVRDGNLPARAFEGEMIFEPLKKRWPCSYCSYLNTCAKQDSGVIPLNPSELE